MTVKQTEELTNDESDQIAIGLLIADRIIVRVMAGFL